MNATGTTERSEFLTCRGISKRYGAVIALRSVSFSIGNGELLSLIGPSGAGKSTLMKILTGLLDPDEGEISMPGAGDEEHPAILVFQDFLLFPHMTVFENVAFGLRAQRRIRRRRGERMSRARLEERVMTYLRRLGIADKRSAYPAQLSGGQRQRVALARALVLEPPLLILDEPFANLDKALKMETARLLRDIRERFDLTMVIVSHDIVEAAAVSDRIGVVSRGELVQIGDKTTLLDNPCNEEVARVLAPLDSLREEAMV